MARRPMTRAEQSALDVAAAAAAMDAWSGKPSPKKKSYSWEWRPALEDVERMMASEDWSEAKPKHFVVLYGYLHERVYEVASLELRTKAAQKSAASLAARALKQFFGGSRAEMAEFMRWTWQRQASEQRQIRAGLRASDFRVTWRHQWSARLVTDYRRAVALDPGPRPAANELG